ncbi:MAG: prolipoprotein diacylglyceryl transferase [Oscillospiraceae bacterium]|nr:prolipoprotein diacylglyceryl transferase [Oscillospiraceae bacterium]
MAFADPSPISFPGLGIEVDPPAGFTIPGTSFEIRFYGLIIAIGVLLAVIYAVRRSREFGLTKDDIYNLVIVGMPCAIIGARLYYVIFEWDRFFGPGTNWYDFLNIRRGGLAIYGGVIGSALAIVLFCLCSKKRRSKLLPYFDITGLGLLIGQAVGRWGNFFNREAHGGPATNILRMGIVEDGTLMYVHPTFLYESVWNLAGLILLHFLSKKRRFDGQVFLCYLAWYGLGRAWIEGLRTDSLWWGDFRVSQVLAAASCLIAVGILLYILLVKRPDPQKRLVNRVSAQADTPEESE